VDIERSGAPRFCGGRSKAETSSRAYEPGERALFCGSLCRPQQIEVTDTERDRYFVHGDYRGIAVAALKTADVLLAEA